MAIIWTEDQHQRVSELIRTYPVQSGRCKELAFGILPVALERDPTSQCRMVRPINRLMRFVVPKAVLAHPWVYHITTTVEAHAVDALTGVSGTELTTYLNQHFEYPEALRLEPMELLK
jgi:hypothetical protein